MLTREQLLELAAVVREETEQGLNSAQRVGHLLYEIVSSFLSKTGNDCTDYELTAEELNVLASLTVAGIQVIGSKNTDLHRIVSTISGAQSITGDQTINGLSNLIGGAYFGPNFVSGLQGMGGCISPNGAAELDSLTLRKWLEVPEMRLNRTVYIAGDLRQSWCNGTVESVSKMSDSTGIIKLKLEDGEGGTAQIGDICMGMYQFGDGNDATVDTDDLKGNVTRAGFSSCYFRIMSVSGRHNEIITYALRPYTRNVVDKETAKETQETYYGRHPHRFMKFAGYGSFTNKTRQASTCITKSYIQFLRDVNDWEYNFKNIAMQMGNLDGLYESYKEQGCPDVTGYSAYLNNIYFTGKMQQVNDDLIDDIEERLKNYNVYFSEHVDVITVDDVGNAIGGLWTEGNDASGQPIKVHRIHSAITVRNHNEILTICGDNETAGIGTYKLYVQPHGCTCIIKDSTLYITSIENIKDGVAGTEDDISFDYNKMRMTEACSVDILVDCEGNGTIVKSFPITIKHQSEPFVSADIDNEFSAVSWNTKAQKYIGLPVSFNMKMWHNNEVLDITRAFVKTMDGTVIAQVDAINGIATASNPDGTVIIIAIKEQEIRLTDGSIVRGKVAYVKFEGLPANVANVTNYYISAESLYAGVTYERTLVHTMNKSSDINVYQLLPSKDQILSKFQDGNRVIDTDSLTCAIHCDSSDDKHYILTDAEIVAAELKVKYSIDKGATKHDYLGAISVDSDLETVIFYLYQGEYCWDQESVPIILDGVDGKGVEFVFWVQESWKNESGNTSDMETPSLYDDSSSANFQKDDYCPFNKDKTEVWTDEPTGVGYNNKYEFYAMRKKVNGVWLPFSDVKLWNRYTVDGTSNYSLDLSNDQSFINCDENGTVLGTYEDTTIMLFKGSEYAYDLFDISIEAHNIGYTHVEATHVITPNNITTANASIVVKAVLKENPNIVLSSVYKVNKAFKGKSGVIYSLLPSVSVIHKYADGTYIDKTMNMQVKRVVGDMVSIIATKEKMDEEDIHINAVVGNSTFPITDPTAIDTSQVCGSNSYAIFTLEVNGVNNDKERINCVLDGQQGNPGEEGKDGIFRQDIFKLATTLPISPSATNDSELIAQGWQKGPVAPTPLLTAYESNIANDGVFSEVQIEYKGGDNSRIYDRVDIMQNGHVVSLTNVGVCITPKSDSMFIVNVKRADGTTVDYNACTNLEIVLSKGITASLINADGEESTLTEQTLTITPHYILDLDKTKYCFKVTKTDKTAMTAMKFTIKQAFRKSVTIADGAMTKETVTVTTKNDGDCLRFIVVASSELNYDFTYVGKPDRIYTDKPTVYTYRTSGDGVLSTVDITFKKAGEHKVEIIYAKDGSYDKFDNCGYYSVVGLFSQTARKLYYCYAKAEWDKNTSQWRYGYDDVLATWGHWSNPVEYAKDGVQGSNGCIQRVWQVFKQGQIYRNDAEADKSDLDSSGLRYLDFMAVANDSLESGWKVYQCVSTHEAGTDVELTDSSLWKEVSVNAQSAFFTFLIAKNAAIQMLSSSKFIITDTDGAAVAGLQNGDVPLWIGSATPMQAAYYVTRNGVLHATGAVIQGEITATKGKIGPFTIGNEGIYTGEPTNWWTDTKSNFIYLNTSSILLEQAIGYFNPGDIAHLKIGLGRGSDPATKDDQEAYCASAMYIYRKMNTASDSYHPAAKIISDNVANRDIALRLEGGLQLWGGLIEKGYSLEYKKSGDTNVIDLSFGTTIFLYTNLDTEPQFFLPTLTNIRKQLGITDTSQHFCIPIRICVRKDSNCIRISTTYKALNGTTAAEGGIFVNNDGGEWENTYRNMCCGDALQFLACYSPSTGFYYQLMVNAS